MRSRRGSSCTVGVVRRRGASHTYMTRGLPLREAGGHMHTAAGNEQDRAASVSAGRDTTNTRHSEPDVANWPQISARQRPRCRERLRRSWVCAPCGIRVTCVHGRGQEDSPQRAHPQPRRSVGSVPSDSRHHEFKPCRTPTGLGNRLCSWKRL